MGPSFNASPIEKEMGNLFEDIESRLEHSQFAAWMPSQLCCEPIANIFACCVCLLTYVHRGEAHSDDKWIKRNGVSLAIWCSNYSWIEKSTSFSIAYKKVFDWRHFCKSYLFPLVMVEPRWSHWCGGDVCARACGGHGVQYRNSRLYSLGSWASTGW